MPTVRELIQDYLAHDWTHDLRPNWRAFFDNGDISPDTQDLLDCETNELFPARLDLGRPRRDEDGPPMRHMTRAFDVLDPDDVRVVILGQDPYPRSDRATGCAFEDGAWREDRPTSVAHSLRRLLQLAAACHRPNLGIQKIDTTGPAWLIQYWRANSPSSRATALRLAGVAGCSLCEFSMDFHRLESSNEGHELEDLEAGGQRPHSKAGLERSASRLPVAR